MYASTTTTMTKEMTTKSGATIPADLGSTINKRLMGYKKIIIVGIISMVCNAVKPAHIFKITITVCPTFHKFLMGKFVSTKCKYNLQYSFIHILCIPSLKCVLVSLHRDR